MITDIPHLLIADSTEVLEQKLFCCGMDIIPDSGYEFEFLSIFRHQDVDLPRHEHARSDQLHKGAADIADLLDLAKVDRHINVGKESLPTVVAVCPSSDHSVCKGCLTSSLVPLLYRLIIDYLTAFCLMVQAGLREFALTILIGQIKGFIALCPEHIQC